MDKSNVTRIELIDQHGRIFVKRVERGSVYCVLQDDNRTLKIFVRTKDVVNNTN